MRALAANTRALLRHVTIRSNGDIRRSAPQRRMGLPRTQPCLVTSGSLSLSINSRLRWGSSGSCPRHESDLMRSPMATSIHSTHQISGVQYRKFLLGCCGVPQSKELIDYRDFVRTPKVSYAYTFTYSPRYRQSTPAWDWSEIRGL